MDVGAKQYAYIKLSELSDDPSAKPEDIVKVGDEVETYVVRVNDVEGYAELSKKRLDAVKIWENIETAVEEKTVLEGTVTEENKGGIVVSVKGIRVFVPASQSGQPRGADLSAMKGRRSSSALPRSTVPAAAWWAPSAASPTRPARPLRRPCGAPSRWASTTPAP